MTGLEINWPIVALRVIDGWLYGTGFVLALLIWYGFINTANKRSSKKKEEKLSIKTDAVNHPKHYTSGKIECIDALEAATAGLTGIEAVCTANAIKYLWRWKQKGGAEDLRKARWYLDKLIETEGNA